MKKIFIITSLSGFILFTLIPMVNAYSPIGGSCRQGDIVNPDVNYPDCITPKSTVVPSTPPPTSIPSSNQSSLDATKPIPTKNPQTGLYESACNPGYHLTSTLNTGETICLKDGATTPGSYEVKINTDTAKGSPTNSLPLPTTVAPRKTTGYNMYVKLPCQSGANCPSTGTPAGYIARLYQFGLMIAGLAAFGSIIYGSLLYVLSAGNIGSQQDARDQITQAILGLALLFGAYLILYTINPNLVSLANPAVEPLNLSGIETPGNEIGTGTQNQNLDPLCKIGAKEGITITEGGSISISGPGGTQNLLEGGRFVCETCKANARKNGNGRCECDTGYVQGQVGSCERPEGVTAPGLLPETDDLQFK